MSRVDPIEPSFDRVIDAVDELRALAETIGARSIADEVQRLRSEAEQSRYTVAIVGGPWTRTRILERILGRQSEVVSRSTVVRFGRGSFRACRDDGSTVVSSDLLGTFETSTRDIEIVGTTPLLKSGACFMWGDTKHAARCVLTTRGDEWFVQDEGWTGVPVLVVDPVAEDIDHALAWIANQTVETGASQVEERQLQLARSAARRLGFHLSELERSLGRTEHELQARAASLEIARVVAESVFEVARQEPDRRREAMIASLGLERTKLVMATKADALAALDERLRGVGTGRDVRQRAEEALHAVLGPLLAGFSRRVQPQLQPPMSELAKRLTDELERALIDLGETISMSEALSGLDVLPINVPYRGPDTFPLEGQIGLLDQMRLNSRQRIKQIARETLVVGLTRHSAAIVDNLLSIYDSNRIALQHRFTQVFGAAIEASRAAQTLAQTSRDDGLEGMARARACIQRWTRRLSSIGEHFA